jgi:hypothetical protein
MNISVINGKHVVTAISGGVKLDARRAISASRGSSGVQSSWSKMPDSVTAASRTRAQPAFMGLDFI